MDKNDEHSPAEERAAGLLRRVNREKGYQKAAEFILLLDKTKAAQVLAGLAPDEVEGIITEIARLNRLDQSEIKKITDEFGVALPASEHSNQAEAAGGLEAAEAILKAAVGEERSQEILSKVEVRLAPGYFDFLKEVDQDRLIALLTHESSAVVALVLAHLPSDIASRILEGMSGEQKTEVVKRIARMEKVLPEVVRRTADSLRKKLYVSADLTTFEIDGKSALRDILKHMNFGQERVILDTLSEEKPELAAQLEKELFTMEIFRKLTDKDLQKFLRTITDRDLALSLKGETVELKELLLKSVSDRRRLRLLEESGLIGEIHKIEAEQAQKILLDALQLKIGIGEIVLIEEHERFIQ
jgi:flagellar motor switch protein FliG